MFPVSKITAKYKYERTKTTHVLTGPVAKNYIEELSKYLQSTWYGIATDKSRDETEKCLAVLDRYEGLDGLIQTSLLDIPGINVGSDAQPMFNTIDNAIRSAKLSWDYCMTYSSINTNSMFGKKNSPLAKFKNAQLFEQKYVLSRMLVTWHISVLKRGQKNFLIIENMITDISLYKNKVFH